MLNKDATIMLEPDFQQIKKFLLILLPFFPACCGLLHAQTIEPTPQKPAGTVKAAAYLQKGDAFRDTRPDSARFYYEKARDLALRSKDTSGLSRYISHYIVLLNHEGRFEDALQLGERDLAIGERLGDSAILMQGYNEVANEYEYLSDYQQASVYYMKALKLAGSRHDLQMERKINNNLGSVFICLKDYTTAYHYSTRAFRLAQEQRDTAGMGNCLINMGVSEVHQQQYELALLHFGQAEKIGYRIKDMTLVGDALSDKGLVYTTTGNFPAAMRVYRKQQEIAEEMNLPYQQLYALFALAIVEKQKGDLKTAEEYASRAIAIGERLGTADELMEMYDSMAVIKRKNGKLADALRYKNKYEALNDSLLNARIRTNIHRLNIQYQTASKNKEIAGQRLKLSQKEAAIERQKTWMLLFSGGLATLVLILMIFWRSYRHKQKLHRQSLLTLQKEHEVNTLRAQMQAREEERNRIGHEMHDDIGSALTNILYLSDGMKTQDREAAMRTADRIAATAGSVVDKMNEIIWSMNREYDTLDDLIAYTRQHTVELLEDRGLQYFFDMPEQLPPLHLTGEQRRNIYLVIKEALHNVIKHACATSICIAFQVNDKLEVTIRDNGKGMDAGKGRRFGNGLRNMQQRMEIIGGSLEITAAQGTTLRLRCPLTTTGGTGVDV